MLRVTRIDVADANDAALARDYLRRSFERGLLILGDLTSPLRRDAEIFIAEREGGLDGAAALFRGFEEPVVALTAGSAETGRALLSTLAKATAPGSILAVNGAEPIVESLGAPISSDTWMTRRTASLDYASGPEALGPQHAEELREFYQTLGLRFWSPGMLSYGFWFCVRSPSGSIASAAGVNFVLKDCGYAQIGGVGTAPSFRGRGMASTCVSAVVRGLEESGIGECGLFAENSEASLVALYERMGFAARGRFLFFEMPQKIG